MGVERSEASKVNIINFFYFKDALNTIAKTTTIQEYRRNICPIGGPDKNGFRKTKLIEWFAFVGIISFKNGIRIRTVVRRIGGDAGQFHFWSVMPFWNLSGGARIIGTKEIEDE